MSFETFHQKKQIQVESALNRLLPAANQHPTLLHQAMRYSTLNGGKRMRALLVYATGEALGLPQNHLDSIACAVECIHAYSLIHDDLPAMDDDDLRRGKPSCHKAYDEATAILAGDALQTLAFEALCLLDVSPELKVNLIKTLCSASGANGMVAGQMIDIDQSKKKPTLDDIENMHRLKTGALISASVCLAALFKYETTDPLFQSLKTYANNVGLAFQIQDDILDEVSNSETLGKTQGKDLEQNKATYPSIIGINASKERANALYQDALLQLTAFGEQAHYLRDIAHLAVHRTY